MSLLSRFVHKLSRIMYRISGVILISVMFIVLADVVTRGVFAASEGALDYTFRGGIELVSYGLLFLILFALPYVLCRAQVYVDLFVENISQRAKQIMGAVYTFGFCLLGTAMTIGFVESSLRVAETGETTQDLLIPMWCFYAIAAFGTAVLALRGLFEAIEQFNRKGEMK